MAASIRRYSKAEFARRVATDKEGRKEGGLSVPSHTATH